MTAHSEFPNWHQLVRPVQVMAKGMHLPVIVAQAGLVIFLILKTCIFDLRKSDGSSENTPSFWAVSLTTPYFLKWKISAKHCTGQQPIWTEQSGPENLDSATRSQLRRGSEICISLAQSMLVISSRQIFWIGANLVTSGQPRNVTEAMPRLFDIRYRD
jgi:hypothetical protein